MKAPSETEVSIKPRIAMNMLQTARPHTQPVQEMTSELIVRLTGDASLLFTKLSLEGHANIHPAKFSARDLTVKAQQSRGLESQFIFDFCRMSSWNLGGSNLSVL